MTDSGKDIERCHTTTQLLLLRCHSQTQNMVDVQGWGAPAPTRAPLIHVAASHARQRSMSSSEKRPLARNEDLWGVEGLTGARPDQ